MNSVPITTENGIVGIDFPQFNKKIFDTSSIFLKTDEMYRQLLIDLGFPLPISATCRDAKRLYTNEFIKCIVELLKSQPLGSEIYMFCQTSTQIGLLKSLIKQLKSLFGIRMLEFDCSFSEFCQRLTSSDCGVVSSVELLFATERKAKSYKRIKKHLEKHGYVFLNDVYFKEFTNKLAICI
jgi:hypothetical protein